MKHFLACTVFAIAALICAPQAGAGTTSEIIFAEEVVSTGEIVLGEEYVTPSAPIKACDPACVKYRYHRLGSRCKFDRCKMHDAVVLVKDPCTHCFVEVPVCVPRCCTSVCSVDCRRGLFGRTIYEYCWDCGFRMEVVVLKDGDMIVHYYGIR